mmetsp:Transcript_64601/g.151833  ORF Transcript_64601/g.151833 Transcript_64601/m.151833 type:complete len:414 (-) Transcript_64601:982-2223(-)
MVELLSIRHRAGYPLMKLLDRAVHLLQAQGLLQCLIPLLQGGAKQLPQRTKVRLLACQRILEPFVACPLLGLQLSDPCPLTVEGHGESGDFLMQLGNLGQTLGPRCLHCTELPLLHLHRLEPPLDLMEGFFCLLAEPLLHLQLFFEAGPPAPFILQLLLKLRLASTKAVGLRLQSLPQGPLLFETCTQLSQLCIDPSHRPPQGGLGIHQVHLSGTARVTLASQTGRLFSETFRFGLLKFKSFGQRALGALRRSKLSPRLSQQERCIFLCPGFLGHLDDLGLRALQALAQLRYCPALLRNFPLQLRLLRRHGAQALNSLVKLVTGLLQKCLLRLCAGPKRAQVLLHLLQLFVKPVHVGPASWDDGILCLRAGKTKLQRLHRCLQLQELTSEVRVSRSLLSQLLLAGSSCRFSHC